MKVQESNRQAFLLLYEQKNLTTLSGPSNYSLFLFPQYPVAIFWLCPQQSTKTVLLKVTEEFLLAKSKGLSSVLILLDLFSPQESPDHSFLLEIFSSLGFHDMVPFWFSCLSYCCCFSVPLSWICFLPFASQQWKLPSLPQALLLAFCPLFLYSFS